MLTDDFSSSINPILDKPQFSIYPNPASSELMIDYDTDLLNEECWIRNTTGQLLWSGQVNSTRMKINLSNISPGGYFLSAGKQTMKVIVE